MKPFKHAIKKFILKNWAFAIVLCLCQANNAFADGKFDNFDVRVIKNKYFQKRFRPEFEVAFGAIMNKTFTNTLFGGGRLNFHLNESWAIGGEGHYALNFRSNDCKVLGSKFGIEPVVENIRWWAGGGLAYTPVYGKFQIPSGQVVYFDWFFNVGVGTAQVEHRETNTCIESGQNNAETQSEDSKNDVVKNGLLIHYGTGQRYFLNQEFALSWYFRFMNIQPTTSESAIDTFKAVPSVLLGMGASYYL